MCVCVYVYECTLKLIMDSFAFSICPQCNVLLFNKGLRDSAMQRGRHMSMHAKSNLLQAPSETQSPTVSADPKCISLPGPDINTRLRSRTNSICTSETLKARAYNVWDLVVSCCATCLQIRWGLKLLHLIGRATRFIPKMFRKSYFCMNNREAKHQDMQIPPSLIGATAWSIFKLCELHLATENVTPAANVQSLTVKTDKMDRFLNCCIQLV